MNRNAFGRARAMFALIAAAMGLAPLARQAALDKVGDYESHGKRKTKTHNRGGTKAFQRAAAKARNKARS